MIKKYIKLKFNKTIEKLIRKSTKKLLKTAENISTTVDEVNQSAKEAFVSVMSSLSENVQNAKDWFQNKKNGKESIETKEDE